MNMCSHAFSVSHPKNMAIQQKYRMDSKEKKITGVYVGGGQLLPQTRFTHYKFHKTLEN